MTPAITMTTWVKPDCEFLIQTLVKRYDGRFKSVMYQNKAWDQLVTISFDDIKNANRFNVMKTITEQVYF